ncbi:DUF4153 domain-containing protein [Jeotgalibaca ciconiae]|uniref:DUF4153 domain-containing protein n=1 Tax=Jeotgalibaca ciconiae TaxID=2496265 RepID=A0A3S9HBA4_9LACT|nr:DUF4153 domain-containing protein [Jeotgalibaca ciconiae]AZP04453.1 DUF4153 domain-containing protein [Jeotgalibaca ciconiae]
MKFWSRLKDSLSGIGQALARYPVTILWLMGIAILNMIEIESSFSRYSQFIFTFVIGAMLSMVGQHIYERFYKKTTHRWLILGGSVLLTILYYFTLTSGDIFEYVYFIRTSVFLFSLLIAFIWIPSISNKQVYFHQNFLAIFKALLTILLFSGVLTIGIFAIIVSIDTLLFTMPADSTIHAANIIWCLFAPVYFLGMVPVYHEQGSQEGAREDAYLVPRFLEILLTYIVIPIVAIYTIILLMYVLLNIGGQFWTDNLLEPLLVAYAIVVIVVYLLSCNIDHRFADLFRKIFPKIMLPIVAFQTISSILKIQEMGITYGRYYVILFGIFAVISGVIFSFFPPNRNGWIAIVLLVLGMISVTPPIDAFTVARNSQMSRLEKTLVENNMIENGMVQADASISVEDKIVVTRSVDNLEMFGEIERVNYLPQDFDVYADFEEVFGFPMTYSTQIPGSPGNYAYLNLSEETVMNVEGVDYWGYVFFSSEEEKEWEVGQGNILKIIYQEDDYFTLQLTDQNGTEIINGNMSEAIEHAFEQSDVREPLEIEDMLFVVENDAAKVTIVMISLDEYGNRVNGEGHLFVDYK